MLLVGVLLIANPYVIFKVLREHSEKLWLHISAIAVRMLLGILLIYHANISNFPIAMEVIGWVAIFAAIVFTVIGRNNFKRLILWAFTLGKPFGQIGGTLALCFGSFLIYAFV